MFHEKMKANIVKSRRKGGGKNRFAAHRKNRRGEGLFLIYNPWKQKFFFRFVFTQIQNALNLLTSHWLFVFFYLSLHTSVASFHLKNTLFSFIAFFWQSNFCLGIFFFLTTSYFSFFSGSFIFFFRFNEPNSL